MPESCCSSALNISHLFRLQFLFVRSSQLLSVRCGQ